MNVTFTTPQGEIRSQIKNIESFHIKDQVHICIADYVKGDDRCPVFLQYGNELELVAIRSNRERARIYAQHAVKSYNGKQGVV